MGGLWEAGVRSVKHHLKRILKDLTMTFEEFYTILTEIEAILNSRPIMSLSSDPSDLSPLTPAHFLVGRPLTAYPEEDVQEVPESRLSRYQHLLKLKQHFWSRWQKEYIAEMQLRVKWKKSGQSLEENDLVLIKEDHTQPMQWKLGRIEKLHPGRDEVTRVVTIRTARGLIKRAVHRVCRLPPTED